MAAAQKRAGEKGKRARKKDGAAQKQAQARGKKNGG
jgi:hypothetical protein